MGGGGVDTWPAEIVIDGRKSCSRQLCDADADAIRLLAYEGLYGLGRGGDAMEVDTAHIIHRCGGVLGRSA